MQLMQMILVSTVNAICLAFAVGTLAYVLVERPDVRETTATIIKGGLCVALMIAVAVLALCL